MSSHGPAPPSCHAAPRVSVSSGCVLLPADSSSGCAESAKLEQAKLAAKVMNVATPSCNTAVKCSAGGYTPATLSAAPSKTSVSVPRVLCLRAGCWEKDRTGEWSEDMAGNGSAGREGGVRWGGKQESEGKRERKRERARERALCVDDFD
eukprot:3382223-Rhodomonas_salina.1